MKTRVNDEIFILMTDVRNSGMVGIDVCKMMEETGRKPDLQRNKTGICDCLSHEKTLLEKRGKKKTILFTVFISTLKNALFSA